LAPESAKNGARRFARNSGPYRKLLIVPVFPPPGAALNRSKPCRDEHRMQHTGQVKNRMT
jgi:hypothetical protein